MITPSGNNTSLKAGDEIEIRGPLCTIAVFRKIKNQRRALQLEDGKMEVVLMSARGAFNFEKVAELLASSIGCRAIVMPSKSSEKTFVFKLKKA